MFPTVGLADARSNGPGLTIFHCTLSPNPKSKTATHLPTWKEYVRSDLPWRLGLFKGCAQIFRCRKFDLVYSWSLGGVALRERMGATALRASSVEMCVCVCVWVVARACRVRVRERERERERERDRGKQQTWRAVAPCQRMLQSPSNNNRSGKETFLLDKKKT